MNRFLVYSLIAVEEESDGPGTGMSTDEHADILNDDFAVQIGECFLNHGSQFESILRAVGMIDDAFTGIADAAVGKGLHLVEDLK